MKTKSAAGIVSGVAIVIVCAIGIHYPQISSAQEPPVSAPTENAQTSATVSPPPDILPTSPLAEVIKLTQSGVDESVIMAYISNSGSTFNLDSDKIIYLSDIGAPNDLVTAMMQRDQFLQQQIAAAVSAQQAAQTAQATQTAPPDYTTDTDTEPQPVTLDYFNTSLTPYGSWVQVPGYGRCWRPTITFYDTAWQPYCDRGHWVYTDYGWYWASDYSWGATFHYGRWFRDERLGWCWTPDTQWAPSWVCWRYSDDYCGWAPLPPGAVFQTGVGFVYRGRNVSAGFDFGLGANAFTFVLTKNFSDLHPRNFRVAPSQVTQIYNRTTVINNFNAHNHVLINSGIPLQHIVAVTHAEIHPVAVREIISADARSRQNHFPNSTASVQMQHTSPLDAPKNQAHSITVYNPGNNGAQHAEIPAQNHFSEPVENHDDIHTVVPQNQTVAPEVHHNFNAPRSEQVPDDSRQNRPEQPIAPTVQPRNEPSQTPTAPQPQKSGRQNKDQNGPGN